MSLDCELVKLPAPNHFSFSFSNRYNTLEPEDYLVNTAALAFFKKRKYSSVTKSSGPLYMRRWRKGTEPIAPIPSNRLSCKGLAFQLAVKRLDEALQIEIDKDQYDPRIGFNSSTGEVLIAADHQFTFIKDVFNKFITTIPGKDLVLSTSHMGFPFGSFNKSPEYRKYKMVTQPGSMKNAIIEALHRTIPTSGERYASFIVFHKYGNEVHHKKHVDMHATVLTVRASGDVKDAVLHDPSPRFGCKWMPKFFLNAKKPMMRSRSVTVGTPTLTADCLYKCFLHIIALKTGEEQFTLNLERVNFPKFY